MAITTKSIDDAIYELPGNIVSSKRKDILMPVLFLLIGAAIFMYGIYKRANANFESAMMLIGVIVAISSLIVLCVRLFGNTHRPYYNTGREFLKRNEAYYTQGNITELDQLLAKCDLEGIKNVKNSTSPTVMLVTYTAKKSNIKIAQVLAYVPHEYRAASDIYILDCSKNESKKVALQ